MHVFFCLSLSTSLALSLSRFRAFSPSFSFSLFLFLSVSTLPVFLSPTPPPSITPPCLSLSPSSCPSQLLSLSLSLSLSGQSAALKTRNNDGENIFLFAARAGKVAVINALAAEPGVDIHCVSHTRVGAVAMAAFQGRTEAVRALVALGCDPLHRDILGVFGGGRGCVRRVGMDE